MAICVKPILPRPKKFVSLQSGILTPNYMKKTLVLLLFISACAYLHAQGSVSFTATVQKDPMLLAENDQPPICNWTNNYSVSFVKYSEKKGFCLIDHSDFFNIYPSGTVSAPACSIYHAVVNLPGHLDYFHVNDIYIADDYAFFCGSIYDTIKHKPYVLYGYFDLNDFFSDSLNINLDTITDGTTTAPVVLERLVAYKYASEYKVVTYGYDEIHKYKILEIDDATNPAPLCNVAEIQQFVQSFPDIQLSDILLTDSYVVFLGHDAYYYAGYCFGRRSSVVADICSPYANIVLVGNEVNGIVKGVDLNKNYIALSYVYCNANAPFISRLRVIDLGSNTNIYSYEFEKPQKEDPIKMVYLEDIDVIELLQPVFDSANYVRMKPFVGANYSTRFLTPLGGLGYNNLNTIGGHCFFSFIRNRYYIQNMTASNPHSNPQCPAVTGLPVQSINNLTLYPSTENVFYNNKIGIIPPISTFNNKTSMVTNCFSHQKAKQ